MAYICKVWFDEKGKHLTQTVLKEVMKKIGDNGKLCRSRVMIYAVLKDRGVHFFEA